MSDPVTNAEIEDVLSSIRRLVGSRCAGRRGSGGPRRAAASRRKRGRHATGRAPGNGRQHRPE